MQQKDIARELEEAEHYGPGTPGPGDAIWLWSHSLGAGTKRQHCMHLKCEG